MLAHAVGGSRSDSTLSTTGLTLPSYTIGVGDRFAHQAAAQLRACLLAKEAGALVCPVWNKSQREHLIIHSDPAQTRAAADAAVRALRWTDPYFCDADHIHAQTMARFLAPCDFFTLDVAESIGKPAPREAVDGFAAHHRELVGSVQVRGVDGFEITEEFLRRTASYYLAAVGSAADVYREIESAKGAGSFVTEISMDETDTPQTPAELLIILAAIADHGIPIQTIALKFTGRFNKGVDYAGDLDQFAREFSDDLAVLAHARDRYELPANLKLSVHSGSDKFSLYAPIRAALEAHNAGVHLKTAGTTWLEEVIGLAEAGGAALALTKEIYNEAFRRRAELTGPYAAVIDIREAQLPDPGDVAAWSSAEFAGALRHDPRSRAYNPSFRQLLHVGYKVAAQLGDRYLEMLRAHETIIARNVTENLFARHIAPLFLGDVSRPSPEVFS